MQNRIFFILFFGIFFLKANIVSSQQKDIYNFSADKLTYSQDNNFIEATGNVVAKNQEGKQISADKILYNKTSQLLKTFGNSKFTKIMRNIGIHTEKSTDIMPDLAIVIDKSFRK